MIINTNIGQSYSVTSAASKSFTCILQEWLSRVIFLSGLNYLYETCFLSKTNLEERAVIVPIANLEINRQLLIANIKGNE